MNAPLTQVRFASVGLSSLAARPRKELDAEVLFDAASRGRYSTDASIYQVEPIGVVLPRSEEAARAALAVAAEQDRKSTRLNSSHLVISYAVFCLKKKKNKKNRKLAH